MSVDFEDYYSRLPFSQWDDISSRIEKPTKIILDLFDKYNVKATFFCLGYTAKRHPDLIKEIVSRGHEIGTHSYQHIRVDKMTKTEFENDLLKSIKIIQEVSGKTVHGYRAPFFSITNNEWAFEVLQKYLDYDSSVYPVNIRYGSLNGAKNAPTHIYRLSHHEPYKESSNGKLIEIPLTTLSTPFGRIPTSGGFYLRFLPIWMIKKAIKKLNKQNFPAIFYIHPQDLDVGLPRKIGYNWYNYYGLKNAVKKFEAILKDFQFTNANKIIEKFEFAKTLGE